MFKKLDTTIIRVSDIVEAKKWYEEKLELAPIYFDQDDKLVVLDAGQNSSLTIWQIKPNEQLIPATSTSCYPIFSVDNAQEIRDRLLQKGVKTILVLKVLKAMANHRWYISNLVGFIRLNLFVKIDLQRWLDYPFQQSHSPP